MLFSRRSFWPKTGNWRILKRGLLRALFACPFFFLHHVMARGIEQRPIFIDDCDRDEFVRRLSDLALEGKLIVYAWSLMPNHFHLMVRTGKISLSRSMRSLLTGYAGYFNRQHRCHGHVFLSEA